MNIKDIKRFNQYIGIPIRNNACAFMYYTLNCIYNGEIPNGDMRVINPNDMEDFVMIGMVILENPHLSPYLAIMSTYSGSWKGVVDNWDMLINEYFNSTTKTMKELYDLLIECINKGRLSYDISLEANMNAKQTAIELFASGLYEEKVSVNVIYHMIPMIVNKYDGKVNISWSWSIDENDEESDYIKIKDILDGTWKKLNPNSGWYMVYRSGDSSYILPENYMTPGSLKVTFPMSSDKQTERKDLFKVPQTNVDNILSMLSIEELRYNGII